MGDSKKRDSIADDWLEVTDAASVKSLDSSTFSAPDSPVLPPATVTADKSIVRKFLDDEYDSEDGEDPTSNGGVHMKLEHAGAWLPGKPSGSPWVTEPNETKYDADTESKHETKANIKGDISEEDIVKERLRYDFNSDLLKIDVGDKSQDITEYQAEDQAEDEAEPSSPTISSSSVQDDEPKTPDFYYDALRALITHLSDISQHVTDLRGERVSTLRLVKAVCQDLYNQAWELEPALKWYAEYWNMKVPKIQLADFPLSPMLLEWMGEIRNHLLAIQSQLNKFVGTEESAFLTASSIPLTVNSALSRGAEALEVCQQTLQEFVPIMMADYNQMRTEGMIIPQQTSQENMTPNRRAPSDSPIYRIRASLYDLKDKVRAASVLLLDFLTEPQPLGRDAVTLNHSLNKVADVISTVLTNHASEWIDSDVQPTDASGLSYNEFAGLDPDVLADISSHVEDFLGEVDVADTAEFKDYGRVMVRNHQKVCLTELGKLDQLKSTVEVMNCIFGVESSGP